MLVFWAAFDAFVWGSGKSEFSELSIAMFIWEMTSNDSGHTQK